MYRAEYSDLHKWSYGRTAAAGTFKPKGNKEKSENEQHTNTHTCARARRERAHSDGARVQELNLKN